MLLFTDVYNVLFNDTEAMYVDDDNEEEEEEVEFEVEVDEVEEEEREDKEDKAEVTVVWSVGGEVEINGDEEEDGWGVEISVIAAEQFSILILKKQSHLSVWRYVIGRYEPPLPLPLPIPLKDDERKNEAASTRCNTKVAWDISNAPSQSPENLPVIVDWKISLNTPFPSIRSALHSPLYFVAEEVINTPNPCRISFNHLP